MRTMPLQFRRPHPSGYGLKPSLRVRTETLEKPLLLEVSKLLGNVENVYGNVLVFCPFVVAIRLNRLITGAKIGSFEGSWGCPTTTAARDAIWSLLRKEVFAPGGELDNARNKEQRIAEMTAKRRQYVGV